MRPCNDCGVRPGELHSQGCDVERCRRCGGQAISCNCVYEEDPEWDGESEPTDAMWASHDAKIEALGGRLPWSGEYPNADTCRELDLWCKWGPGWKTCDRSDPEATEDLNRLLQTCNWNPVSAKFERRA